MSFTNTYSAIAARVADYTNNKPGGSISNLVLDLVNRAQYQLWMAKDWDYLKKTTALTLSGLSAAMPTDFGRLLLVFHDSDNDGKPDKYYYRDGDRDCGYSLVNSFAKATGDSLLMTFFSSPSVTPKVKYIIKLVDFTGTGTEYSFFPGELVFNKAKLLHIEDGLGSKEDYPAILNSFKTDFDKYVQAVQYVNSDPNIGINDIYGNRVYPNGVSLDGPENSYSTQKTNDTRFY